MSHPIRTLYLAGPMSGLPQFNYPAFGHAAVTLRGLGYAVLNPADNPLPPCGGTWQGWMRAAITQPKLLDAVAACKGLEWIAVTMMDAGDAPARAPAHAEAFERLMGERAPARAPDPLAAALILFTTGTTSRAKGVVWTHANVLWGGKMAALQQGIRHDDIYHVFLPLFHVVGFSWSFLAAFFAGGTIVLQPRFSGSRFWSTAVAHKATIASQVKFTTSVLAQQPVPAHSFRQFTTANHSPSVAKHFGVREVSGWGMTEMVAQGIVGSMIAKMVPLSIVGDILGHWALFGVGVVSVVGVLHVNPLKAFGELDEDIAVHRALLDRLDSALADKAARLDDGQRLLALNELFIGHRTHQSARYRVGS